MKRDPTIEDVARIAGVSKSTVSRVINNSPRISEATRTRVLNIINDIGYEPNKIARSLSKRRTGTIGVILEDIVNPFFTEVAKGIESVLKEKGYTMLLTSTDYQYESEYKYIKLFLQYRVDGILITPVSPDTDAIMFLKQRKVPFFLLNSKSYLNDVNWIDSDNFEGGYIAGRYLVELGHRNFMFLYSREVLGAIDRFNGFKKALEEAEINIDEQIVFYGCKSRLDGYQRVKEFTSSFGVRSFPTAIAAVNDAVAIGAMQALFENNIKVPDDVSVIGYDDINIAGFVLVPLTTVHQSKFRMGSIAAKQLIESIESEEQEIVRQILVKPKLIVRKSCKRINDEEQGKGY